MAFFAECNSYFTLSASTSRHAVRRLLAVMLLVLAVGRGEKLQTKSHDVGTGQGKGKERMLDKRTKKNDDARRFGVEISLKAEENLLHCSLCVCVFSSTLGGRGRHFTPTSASRHDQRRLPSSVESIESGLVQNDN